MTKLDVLKGLFREDSIGRLEGIFEQAGCGAEEKLQEELHSVLQQEQDNGVLYWKSSPSGKNHIVVKDQLCLLVNVFGAFVLFEDWLFFDGELSISDFHWMEDDHLVVFEVCYIVRDMRQKCICHFADTDFFVYFTEVEKNNAPYAEW